MNSKSVVGNKCLMIDLDGKITKVNGEECTLPIIDNKVEIEIYSVTRSIDLDWLVSASHLELSLPHALQDRILDISFVDGSHKILRKICPVEMVFNKPIDLEDGFRIIPGYTQYAINKEGIVKNIRTNNIIKPYKLGDSKYYPMVSLYNPDKSGYRGTLIHRLVAAAWVFGANRYSSYVVNHKDGNKHNFHYRNLEWVTPTENNIHAFENELRDDNIPCRVRDTTTGQITEFQRVQEACRHMGITERYLTDFDFDRPSKIVKDRYEIRFGDDTTEWVYKEGEDVRAGRYTITVKDGTRVETFHDTRDFQKRYGIWNINYGLKEMIDRFNVRFPDREVTYVDHYDTRPIQCIDINTLVITEEPTIMAFADKLGISKGKIRHVMITGETQIADGYAFRRKTDKKWDTNFVEFQSRSMCILATHQSTNEVLEFESLRAVADHFKKDRSVFKGRLKNGKEFEGWTFKTSI